jgi:hypothetical protein
MNKFNLMDPVRWGERNVMMPGQRKKTDLSFHYYQGVVIGLQPLTVQYQAQVGKDTQQFRQLKNGEFIVDYDGKDDPKGRMYLRHDGSRQFT